METKLKSCFFSAALLVAIAARGDGAVSSSAGDDGGYRAADLGQVSQGAAPETSRGRPEETDGIHEGMTSRDAATTGSGSGESARQTDADWNRQEFLRNVWNMP